MYSQSYKKIAVAVVLILLLSSLTPIFLADGTTGQDERLQDAEKKGRRKKSEQGSTEDEDKGCGKNKVCSSSVDEGESKRLNKGKETREKETPKRNKDQNRDTTDQKVEDELSPSKEAEQIRVEKDSSGKKSYSDLDTNDKKRGYVEKPRKYKETQTKEERIPNSSRESGYSENLASQLEKDRSSNKQIKANSPRQNINSVQSLQIWSDGFEDGTLDPWGSSGTVSTTTAQSHSGSYSAELDDTDSNTDALYIGFVDRYENMTWSTYVRPDSTSQTFRIYLGNNDNPNSSQYTAGVVMFYNNGFIYAWDGNGNGLGGGSHTSLKSYMADTWYHVNVTLNCRTNSYDVYIDSVKEADDFGFRYNQTTVDGIQFVTDDDETPRLFVDDVTVYAEYINVEFEVTTRWPGDPLDSSNAIYFTEENSSSGYWLYDSSYYLNFTLHTGSWYTFSKTTNSSNTSAAQRWIRLDSANPDPPEGFISVDDDGKRIEVYYYEQWNNTFGVQVANSCDTFTGDVNLNYTQFGSHKEIYLGDQAYSESISRWTDHNRRINWSVGASGTGAYERSIHSSGGAHSVIVTSGQNNWVETYYHQWNNTVGVQVAGCSDPFIEDVSITYTAFGGSTSVTLGNQTSSESTSIWSDCGNGIIWGTSIVSGNERFYLDDDETDTETVSSGGNSWIKRYYHQYDNIIGVNVANWDDSADDFPGDLSVQYTSLGEPTTLSIGGNQKTASSWTWTDCGQSIDWPNSVSSGATDERWHIADGYSDPERPSVGSGGQNWTLDYYHQYRGSPTFKTTTRGSETLDSTHYAVVSYQANGSSENVNIWDSSQSNVWVDDGSTYSFTHVVENTGQRWYNPVPYSGIFDGSTVNESYFEQWEVTFRADTVGPNDLTSGNGVTVQYDFCDNSLGNSTAEIYDGVPDQVWVDDEAVDTDGDQDWAYPSESSSSGGSHRWFNPAPRSGEVNASDDITEIYYDQFNKTIGASVVNSCHAFEDPVQIDYTSLGTPGSVFVANASTSGSRDRWLDTGTDVTWEGAAGGTGPDERFVHSSGGTYTKSVGSGNSDWVESYYHQDNMTYNPDVKTTGGHTYALDMNYTSLGTTYTNQGYGTHWTDCGSTAEFNEEEVSPDERWTTTTDSYVVNANDGTHQITVDYYHQWNVSASTSGGKLNSTYSSTLYWMDEGVHHSLPIYDDVSPRQRWMDCNTTYNVSTPVEGPNGTYVCANPNVTADSNNLSTSFHFSNETTSNLAPHIFNPNPGDGSTGIPLSLDWSVNIIEPEGEPFNWSIECSNGASNSSTGADNGTKSLSLSGLDYSTTFQVWVNATDGTNWTREQYTFTTRGEFVPAPPSNFAASSGGRTSIDLTWTRDPLADTTYIEYSASADSNWVRGEHTSIYNGSGESFPHTGLNEGTTYYYKAWSWNSTDNEWSSSGVKDNATTAANDPPILSDETPANGTGSLDTSFDWHIDISDADGDQLNWSIECSDGNSSAQSLDPGGTKYLSLSNLNYSTQYTVWVNVSDGFDSVKEWYTFTTRGVNEPSIPANFTATALNRTAIQLSWDIGVNTDQTHVRYLEGDTPPADRNEGTLVYNGSGTLAEQGDLSPGQQYSFKAWSWNQTGNNWSDGAVAYEFTLTNSAPMLSNPDPANQTSGLNLSLTWSIQIEDPDGDDLDWWINCSNGDTNSAVGDGNGTKSLSITGLDYNTTYTVSVEATDGYSSSGSWFVFTTRDEYVPDAPSDFVASPDNRTRISLTWTQATDADRTYIMYKAGDTPPTDRSDGDMLYNGTGTSTTLTGLSPDEQYSFKAWSWNETDHVFSIGNVTSQATTDTNTAPQFNAVDPTNGTTGVELSFNWSVLVEDPENDLFQWSIECSNGNSSSEVSSTSGWKNLTIDGLEYNTQYKVWVNASDQYDDNGAWYTFTTRGPTEPDPPTEFTAVSTGRHENVISWVMNGSAQSTYVEWSSTSDGSWSRGDHTQLYNGSDESFTHSGLDVGTTYYYKAWSFNATYNVWSSGVEANAMTEENHLPALSDETPENGTTGLNLSFTWSVAIEDQEGDNMDYTIECDSGATTSGSSVGNGTYSLEVSGLEYGTQYTVWVNVTDGYNHTRDWYVFTARQAYTPGAPSGFSGMAEDRHTINLTWSDGSKTDSTYVEWSTSPLGSWSRGDQNILYNGTAEGVTHTDLDMGTTYYYKAWSWNASDKVWGTGVETQVTTVENYGPTFSNEDPENGSTGVELSFTWSVYIEDPEEDTFNWTIECSNGDSAGGNETTAGTKTLQVSGLDYITQYRVTVTATDGNDMTRNWYTFTTISTDQNPPEANAGSDKTVEVDEEVTFDGSGSSDDVGIVSFEWTFDGEETRTGETVQYTFSSPGVYNATLNVTDGGGNYDTDSITVRVEDTTAPQADAGDDKTVEVDEEVTFEGDGSTDNVGIVNYTWTFEYEGTTKVLHGSTASFTFEEPGNYTVTLEVTDEGGNTAQDTFQVNVEKAGGPGGGPSKGFQIMDYLPYILLAIVILVILIILLVFTRKREEPEEAPVGSGAGMGQPREQPSSGGRTQEAAPEKETPPAPQEQEKTPPPPSEEEPGEPTEEGVPAATPGMAGTYGAAGGSEEEEKEKVEEGPEESGDIFEELESEEEVSEPEESTLEEEIETPSATTGTTVEEEKEETDTDEIGKILDELEKDIEEVTGKKKEDEDLDIDEEE